MDQQELLDAIIALFPDFKEHWEDEDNYYISERGEFNLHNVCKALAHFYIDSASNFSDEQQTQLFSCLDNELLAAGDSAAAIKLGFIESIALTDIGKTAASFMGAQAKAHFQDLQE